MFIRTHLRNQIGQTTAEYGMVLGVIALAVAVAMTVLAGAITHTFSSI